MKKCRSGIIKEMGTMSKEEHARAWKDYRRYLRTGKKRRGVYYFGVETVRRKR